LYLVEGNDGTIRISMPTGGYVPEFQKPGAVAASAKPTVSQPTVLVAPFDGGGDPAALLNLNSGFSRQVMIALHHLGECVAQLDRAAPGRAGESEVNVLIGDVAVVGDRISATALLLEIASGKVLWGSSFQRIVPQGRIVAVRDEVADCVACALHAFMSGRAGVPAATALTGHRRAQQAGEVDGGLDLHHDLSPQAKPPAHASNGHFAR
jgi:TolB-like protein